MRFLRVVWRSFLDFFRDDGMMLAASLSYFTMMAVVPFCLFLITLFGYFLGYYPDFYSFLVNRLRYLFPTATDEITREIVKLITHKGLGKVSLLLYGFLSLQLFYSLENSLNVIFRIRKKRHFFFSVMISVFILTFIMLILTISFGAATLIPLLSVLKEYFPVVKIGRVTGFLIRYVVPFILVLLTVTILYILLPKVRIRISSAFWGALFTTGLLELAKHVFTWYVGSVGEFGRIYGPLTAFIVFLLWTYYSSSIFLIGAEVVRNLGGTARLRGEG